MSGNIAFAPQLFLIYRENVLCLHVLYLTVYES